MKTTRKVTTAAATFGAALTSLYVAPELQAQVNDLTFGTANPVAFGAGTNFGSVGVLTNVFLGTVFQDNNPGGKNAIASTVGLGNLALVDSGQLLRASTFDPVFIAGGVPFSADATGTVFLGFLNPADTANADPDDDIDRVGWFAVDLGGTGGDVTFLEGQFGFAGEDVIVGGAVPEPSGGALAALALGAIGLRRKRKA